MMDCELQGPEYATVTNGNKTPPNAKAVVSKQIRLLVIGAGARGNAYARAVTESTNACVYAVADPIKYKRDALGQKYIWHQSKPSAGQTFEGWTSFLEYEKSRRKQRQAGQTVPPGVDGVFICTLDETHVEIVLGLAPLKLHLMSEKPLATTLSDCLKIYRSLQPISLQSPESVLSTGHVLHYSPHNMLLKTLLKDYQAIGEILSIEHTEPVGWWHFSHSYVRAKKIYEEACLDKGNAGWPVHIVDPEIEDFFESRGLEWAKKRLQSRLEEDYSENTSHEEIDRRPWFGRCVWESDNDVCDDQIVTMTWEDDPLPPKGQLSMTERLKGRRAKTATFHMIAHTEKQCKRRGRIYGSKGEIEYDSQTIRLFEFGTSKVEMHRPHQPGGGHGGGDDGLARQFVTAIEAVEHGACSVEAAQKNYIGCTLEDVIRSHAMVFAAEEARRKKEVVNWPQWWRDHVEADKPPLHKYGT
ncbi:MAG: hypothetical protein LQ342_000041 [Letrouitia transgressa]|nr:MAG: hypothetical protein LQ342_000041 [Letrouitia transgressa]